MTGWIRMQRTDDGSFTSRPLGFGRREDAGHKIAEAAGAVAESRRPRTALSDAPALAKRRERLRNAAHGMRLEQVHSAAFESMAHDGDSVLAVRFHDYYRKRDDQWVAGKTHGYRVSPEDADAIRYSASAGKAFARLAKNAEKVELDRCIKCARFYEQGRAHSCKGSEDALRPGGVDATNATNRRAGMSALRSRLGL